MSDEFKDQSTSEIVESAEERAQRESQQQSTDAFLGDEQAPTTDEEDAEPAADQPINHPPKVHIGRINKAERRQALEDIAKDDEPFGVASDFENRFEWFLERLVELSVLGIFIALGMVWWYDNWTPVWATGIAIVWPLVALTAFGIARRLTPKEKRRPRGTRTVMSRMVIAFPSLLVFFGSFFYLSPDVTGKYWTIQMPLSDQYRTVGPGEWILAPPFFATIEGTNANQDLTLDCPFLTKDGVPMTAKVDVEQSIVASNEVLSSFVPTKPAINQYLREQSKAWILPIVRSILQRNTAKDLLNGESTFTLRVTGDVVSDDADPNNPILRVNRLKFYDFVVPNNREWAKKGSLVLEDALEPVTPHVVEPSKGAPSEVVPPSTPRLPPRVEPSGKKSLDFSSKEAPSEQKLS